MGMHAYGGIVMYSTGELRSQWRWSGGDGLFPSLSLMYILYMYGSLVGNEWDGVSDTVSALVLMYMYSAMCGCVCRHVSI